MTFIPFRTFEKQKISSVEEGGVISESTLPQGFSLQGRSIVEFVGNEIIGFKLYL